jgi:hypothetical protein
VKEHEHFRQDDCRKCYGRDRFVLGSVTATEATVADRIAQPGPRLSRSVRTHQHSTLARLTMRLVTITLDRSRAPWWSKPSDTYIRIRTPRRPGRKGRNDYNQISVNQSRNICERLDPSQPRAPARQRRQRERASGPNRRFS